MLKRKVYDGVGIDSRHSFSTKGDVLTIRYDAAAVNAAAAGEGCIEVHKLYRG